MAMNELLNSLLQGAISAHEWAFPRQETGVGLRPQSDQATQILMDAMRQPGQTGETARAGLLAPGTTPVSMGPRSWGDVIPNLLMGAREYLSPGNVTAGFWNPQTQNITLRPGGLSQFYAFDPSMARATAPHEIFHMMRSRAGLDVGNEPQEEALARLATDRPLVEAGKQLGGGPAATAQAAGMRPQVRQTIKAAVPTALHKAAQELGITLE